MDWTRKMKPITPVSRVGGTLWEQLTNTDAVLHPLFLS